MITYGQCLCAAVEFSVSGEPNWSSHCHCNTCRQNSGAAVATFVSFPISGFTLTKGQLCDYQSSPGVTRSFCGNCGSPIVYRSDAVPLEAQLVLGSLKNPEDFPAQLQVFCAEKLPWVSIDNHIPKFDGLPDV